MPSAAAAGFLFQGVVSGNTQRCRESPGKGMTGVALLNFKKKHLDFLSALGPHVA